MNENLEQPISDPDGDAIEAIMWMSPDLLVDNPVVRDELSADMLAVLDQLQGSGSDEEIPSVGPAPGNEDPQPDPQDPGFIAKAAGAWDKHPVRHVEDKLAAAHAGPVQAALAGSVSPAQLRALAEKYVATQSDA